MKKAVFLDRDGVINPNVFYKTTGEWESPLYPKDFKLFPRVIESLQKLQEYSYSLFLVSNQPGCAKGKTSIENLKAIHEKLRTVLVKNQVHFEEYYYCYHHPQGIVPELAIECKCRKPGTLFLEKAKKKYGLDMSLSWMVGDRDSDVFCGQKAGTRTIMILNQQELQQKKVGASAPDYKAVDLPEAVSIIIRENTK